MKTSESSRWSCEAVARAILIAVLALSARNLLAQSTESSLPAAFGKSLAGGAVVNNKDEYRQRPITVECRARLNAATSFNVLVASDPKTSSQHWELYSYGGTGEFAMFAPGYGGDFHSQFNIADGKWHQLAAYLGTDVVKLYVDGEKVLDKPAAPSGGDQELGDLAFGQLVDGSIGCDGLIDDVRISRGEIAIVRSDKPAVKTPETLGLWNFDALPGSPEKSSIVNVPLPAADTPPPSAMATPPVTAPITRAPPTSAEATPGTSSSSRDSLPEYKIIPAASTSELTAANGWPTLDSYKDWSRSLGGPTSNRYSTLAQVNRNNVANLQVAWTYHSKDGAANIQCNPIIVGKVMFLPTAGGNLAALNAATGEELWRFKPPTTGPMSMEGVPARRGLLYWPGDGNSPPRILVGIGSWIYALDPKTGQVIPSFGQQGRTSLPAGATAAGAVYKGILVMPGYAQDVFGYDAGTGKQLWRFRTVPAMGEAGADTWKGTEHFGANDWGGMALDESRGIAYVATGSPKPNYVGIQHHGDNLFSDCVIALKVETGQRLWHFQEIRHDIWDMDIPAPPNLVTVMHDGRHVDAVAQVTKYGNTLLLDRVTGKPLFPFRLRRAPASNLPGEETASYQPDLQLPQPFAKEEFARADITNRSAQARAYVEGLLANAKMGFFESIEEHKPLAYFGVHGGAEWTGAAFEPTSGRLFVSTNHMPWLITAIRDQTAAAPVRAGDQVKMAVQTPGEKVYLQNCAACHGQDRAGQGMIPPLRGIGDRLKESEVMLLSKNGRNSMPPPAPMSDGQRKQLMDFLFERDRAPQATAANSRAPAHYTFNGYNKLLDQDQYPGNKPPWGTLDCIDLNTGKTAWSVPLGEYPELTRQGIPRTGQENFGGAMVTAGGLVFCSGTRDNKIRAFSSVDGKELWSAILPLHGTAPPATYEVDGRQFVVLPATGGGKLGGPQGDSWVSFALPKN